MIKRRGWLAACLLLLGVFVWIAPCAAYASLDKGTIQQLIDEAKPGDTVTIAPGEYRGAITIDKSVTLVGEPGTVIVNDAAQPAVTITADGVSVSGITVEQRSMEESTAIELVASNTMLSNLDIHTHAFGIRLRKSNRNEIADNSIQWLGEMSGQEVKMSAKRNGIDLYDSHDNVISGNRISSMNDGIYQESSHRNQVIGNRIDHSRYGIHCMYTEGTIVRGNAGNYNVTGAMVMGVTDAIVEDNSFTKQSENVNSQGLLLFDVHTSTIANNRVEGNRIGFYVEQSSKNDIRNNSIERNFVGIQFLESEGNELQANDFIANVINAEATDSPDNRLTANFWDNFSGIDADGNGRSDISYAINPFFQQLTHQTPAFQLFFQSPGMQFLETMMQSDRSSWTVDIEPLMMPAGQQAMAGKHNSYTFWVSLCLLLISTIIIYNTGVKRT
ncbi:nitrous oxidase accessory protein [Paenibacillus cellulosilyticus]|uniref:Nitrous oxidase accessory protein n=1 Tax=Paenibacillus cellulosilyticus TaxID=375489 RepID=A0A2V2YF65_9BACL|nr:NosD domain-containing protein [Paenibacillus cellulosilyticus]PWV89435.1 nitrous oxidase accessory protein [Paenibacillus cellulosilyticus]QKS47277.1 right-handed parallel beta-helix repeat-containing protein [Paenibacillus cellulosilyticus]